MLWHLITSDNQILRSTHADHRDEARIKLAPISKHQMVVSAVSFDVKEPREIAAIREATCELCHEPMSHEPAGIYSTMHRSCYEKRWRDSMSAERKADFLARRREYQRKHRGIP